MKRGQLFNQVSMTKPRKNLFDLSHERKLSMNMGELIPIFLEEVVPSDKFRVKTEHLIRLAPMVAPVMHRVNVFIHYFYVPMRLVWDGYENFFTGGKDGKTFPEMPYILIENSYKSAFYKGELPDYMGIPILAESSTITYPQKINALPFRAYQKIYNDYYRDQNLTSEINIGMGDGQDTIGMCTKRLRAWERDYFTSALPDTQAGDDVLIPTDIIYKPDAVGTGLTIGEDVKLSGSTNPMKLAGKSSGAQIQIENIESIGSTINDLRTSVRLQEFLERSMRGGRRYVEHALSFFGVKPDDARIQRPEYLGGGKAPIVISEVLATFNSQTDDVTNPTYGGQMYGHGVSAGNNAGFTKFFPEHGYVIGIMSVVPRSEYVKQGIDKMFLRKDRMEYFYPQFAHLGEEAILSKELFWNPNENTENDAVFGYTPRYSSYKYRASSVHGDFADQLDFWHLAKKYTNRPLLVQTFIEANPALMNRIFADTTATHKLYVQLYNDVKAIRPMPVFGTPKL